MMDNELEAFSDLLMAIVIVVFLLVLASGCGGEVAPSYSPDAGDVSPCMTAQCLLDQQPVAPLTFDAGK